MERERFTLLLLEPGEIYFEDFSAVLLKTEADSEDNPGRLKLCSKSIVFEGWARSEPLLKISFKDCSAIERIKKDSGLEVVCSQHALMLKANILAPYSFVREKRCFRFVLNYGSAGDCVQQMNQLKRASSLPACEQSSMIATICHSRYSRMKFNPLWLDDIYDNIILEIDADRITPLVQNPGKVVLTAKTLFFQPCNNIETYPVLKIKLSSVKRVFKRRFLLKQTGLEIYSDDVDIPHLYLSFRKESDREKIYSEIMNQPSLNLDIADQTEMTMKWQNGIISNYDYLLYLNCLADRTKNDLTQYPVFPWILNNYTSSEIDLEDVDIYRDLSKPIGALNEDRLQRLKERYDEMAPPKFLYGSHYSAPGLVLFYLVRTHPQYMLCLQNGRFDHPDRMFNSLSDVYRNCLHNMSDFKELIPEFYDLANEGDFLINKYGINFGYKHDSTKVDNVQLPAWAESPKHFIQTMRNALESDYVTRNLHKWIDLIFGYKQRGDEAMKANNIFYHLCYEGSVNLDEIGDINDRHALEVQIMEFGQIPKQVFQSPHVKRSPIKISRPITVDVKSEDEREEKINNELEIDNLEILYSFDSHRDKVNAVITLSNSDSAVSVGQDGLLKMYSLKERKQTMSIRLGSAPLSCCAQIKENIIAVGSWNNDILLYDLEYGRIEDTLRAHNGSVSVLLWSQKEQILISGGWDCGVNIWNLSQASGKVSSRLRLKLIASIDHESKITTLALNKDSTILLSGTEDGDILLWNLSTKLLKRDLPKHSSAITGSIFVWHDKRLITCSIDGELRVTDMVADCQVMSKFLSEGISSSAWDNDRILYLGGTEGTLFVWDLQTVQEIHQISICNDPISCIALTDNSSYIICGSANHQVKILCPKSSMDQQSR